MTPKQINKEVSKTVSHFFRIESTNHRLINGDARNLSFIPEKSVRLTLTSSPYWNLKKYNDDPNQLGHINDYDAFLSELEKVWKEVFRFLVSGGRLVCVVGDVCVSRKNFGRHLVFPLHSDISVICRTATLRLKKERANLFAKAKSSFEKIPSEEEHLVKIA